MSELLIIGAACIDNVVSVKKYPSPEDKIRAESSLTCGGGNAGNTAMAISRLGITPTLITKVGKDSNGEAIINEFSDTCTITDCIISSSKTPTACTFVIVDTSTTTRTCIHTPLTEELTESDIDSILLKLRLPIKILHFDSRHTIAACNLATELRTMSCGENIITTIDLEKIRPNIYDLLPFVDIIFTNLKCVDEFFPDE
jgi:sugar/nucleoside kinase (ribokinase family)